jgi:hypothetical protein
MTTSTTYSTIQTNGNAWRADVGGTDFAFPSTPAFGAPHSSVKDSPGC